MGSRFDLMILVDSADDDYWVGKRGVLVGWLGCLLVLRLLGELEGVLFTVLAHLFITLLSPLQADSLRCCEVVLRLLMEGCDALARWCRIT